jgi:hypothetical protein
MPSEAETQLKSDQPTEHHHHHAVDFILDGAQVTSPSHRLTGVQIRELGKKDRVHGFKTEIVTGHVRVIGDHDEVEVHNQEHFRTVIEIYLDGELVLSHSKTLTGRQIRELGPADRVDGFETQEIDEHGKKKRTIGDSEPVEIHEHERFRTVPNHGGPGAAV